jgi:hypothetical protein
MSHAFSVTDSPSSDHVGNRLRFGSPPVWIRMEPSVEEALCLGLQNAKYGPVKGLKFVCEAGWNEMRCGPKSGSVRLNFISPVRGVGIKK